MSSTLNAIVCGNGPLRHRMHKIGLHGNPLCRYGCEEEESIDHVLFRCKHLAQERTRIQKKCNQLGITCDKIHRITHAKIRHYTAHMLGHLG